MTDGIRTIVHPRRHTNQRRAYRQTCTIQEATETRQPNGEVVLTWADVGGLTALPCVFANEAGLGRVSRQERRKSDATDVVATYLCALGGHYAAITEQHRAAITDERTPNLRGYYNIIGIDHDSQASTTRLRLEQAAI
ncbi:MAG: hypothetical protein KDE45_05575 [Caldilineaceae bacterium]|nr:hypothetical protein [Caldilineaceae bacterium]